MLWSKLSIHSNGLHGGGFNPQPLRGESSALTTWPQLFAFKANCFIFILDAYKFVVALYNTKMKMVTCGGTLVSTFHILTAAHCINRIPLNNYLVKRYPYKYLINIFLSVSKQEHFGLWKSLYQLILNPTSDGW